MSKIEKEENYKPLIPNKTNLEDLTVRSVVMGSLLSVILGASTTYLALRIGVTVSASIPSIALCVAIFRILKPSNALEVNMIQTIASAGYVVGSVAAFVLPGLIMIGVWTSFDYFYSLIPLIIGCVFGVYLSIPLRSYYFNNLKLRYPEGLAAANLIKEAVHVAKQKSKASSGLLCSIVVGAVLQFLQQGLRIIPGCVSFWKSIGSVPVGMTIGVTPSLVGVGYIIGFREGLVCFSGTFLSMVVGVPILGSLAGATIDPANVEASMMGIWAKHVRFIGVGVMLMGGLLLCVSLVKPIIMSVKAALKAATQKTEDADEIPRTERDLPIKSVLRSYIFFTVMIGVTALLPFCEIKQSLTFGLIPSLLIISMASFIFSAISASIGGYMAGVVGSSYNPLSGVSIINICLFSILLSCVVDVSTLSNPTSLIALVLFLTTYAGGACSISCDNIQDLKAGHIIGATPWKQQVGLVIGSVCGALVVPLVLQILLEGYGIGDYHPNAVGPVDPTKTLQAPKAVLLSSLAKAIFQGDLDWLQVQVGMVVGLIVHAINMLLKNRGRPIIGVLSVGVGIYMPLEITAPLFVGGLVYRMAERKNPSAHSRMIVPSGLVAGEAMTGVVIAGALMMTSSFSAWRDTLKIGSCLAQCLSIMSLLLLLYMLYQYGRNRIYKSAL